MKFLPDLLALRFLNGLHFGPIAGTFVTIYFLFICLANPPIGWLVLLFIGAIALILWLVYKVMSSKIKFPNEVDNSTDNKTPSPSSNKNPYV